MVWFCRIAGGAIIAMLLHFLLCSRFTISNIQDWRQALCWIGCSAILCLDFHWAVQLCAVFTAAVFLAWYIGRARLAEALSFGVLFGIMRLVALLLAFGVSQAISYGDAVVLRIVELSTFYALVAFASVIRSSWQDAPMPILRLIPVWLICVILCEEMLRNRSWSNVVVLQFFSVAWLIYAGITLIPVKKKMVAAQQAMLEQQQKVYHYAMQEEYYHQLQSKQAETRALWHDLNKYLRAAKVETDSACALEQLGAMLDSSMEIVDVGNPVLNVILNEYAQTAKAVGIELRMRVQVPEQLGISAADLYVMIGNTMDNAIEACKALPAEQRMIELVMRMHYDTVYFQLTNPYTAEQPKRRANALRGYGLDNVRRCVERYNGGMEIFRDRGFFTVTVHLNQNTDTAGQ